MTKKIDYSQKSAHFSKKEFLYLFTNNKTLVHKIYFKTLVHPIAEPVDRTPRILRPPGPEPSPTLPPCHGPSPPHPYPPAKGHPHLQPAKAITFPYFATGPKRFCGFLICARVCGTKYTEQGNASLTGTGFSKSCENLLLDVNKSFDLQTYLNICTLNE